MANYSITASFAVDQSSLNSGLDQATQKLSQFSTQSQTKLNSSLNSTQGIIQSSTNITNAITKVGNSADTAYGKLTSDINGSIVASNNATKAVSQTGDAAKEAAGKVGEASKEVEGFSLKTIVEGNLIAEGIIEAFKKLKEYTIDAFKEAKNSVTELYNAAANNRLDFQSLQQLTSVAKLLGVSTEQISASFEGIRRSTAAALSAPVGESNDQLNAFKTIGLDIATITRLSPDQLFLRIASSLKNVSNVAQQADLADKLLGDGGKDVLGLLNTDIPKAIDNYNKLGTAITNTQAANIKNLSLAENQISELSSGFYTNLTADLAPAFTSVLNLISDTITKSGSLKDTAQAFADAMISGISKAASFLDNLEKTFQKIYNSQFLQTARDVTSNGFENAIQFTSDQLSTARKVYDKIETFVSDQFSNADRIINKLGEGFATIDNYIAGGGKKFGIDLSSPVDVNKFNGNYALAATIPAQNINNSITSPASDAVSAARNTTIDLTKTFFTKLTDALSPSNLSKANDAYGKAAASAIGLNKGFTDLIQTAKSADDAISQFYKGVGGRNLQDVLAQTKQGQLAPADPNNPEVAEFNKKQADLIDRINAGATNGGLTKEQQAAFKAEIDNLRQQAQNIQQTTYYKVNPDTGAKTEVTEAEYDKNLGYNLGSGYTLDSKQVNPLEFNQTLNEAQKYALNNGKIETPKVEIQVTTKEGFAIISDAQQSLQIDRGIKIIVNKAAASVNK